MSLEKILRDREERAKKQEEFHKRWNSALVCFSLNLPGRKKFSQLLFYEGKKLLDFKKLETHEGENFLLCASNEDAAELKKRLSFIEQTHPLGRFFDYDVFDKDFKKLSRPTPRSCFVCPKEAFLCSRTRAHSLERLQRKIQKSLTHYYAQRLSQIASEALIREVDCTPKPGLVDKMNSGSHHDMDHALFVKSALSLKPYFFECVRRGFQGLEKNPETFFKALRPIGIAAEKKMYGITEGINTHKGAIFTLGLFCAAQARLLSLGKIPNEKNLQELIEKMCKAPLKKELSSLKGLSAGERIFKKWKIPGIRGQASEGFSFILHKALPFYRKELAQTQEQTLSELRTFLYLLTQTQDTNLLHRGGPEGLAYAQYEARSLLETSTNLPKDLEKLDEAFRVKRLSPGGTADLLALVLFLDSSLA